MDRRILFVSLAVALTSSAFASTAAYREGTPWYAAAVGDLGSLGRAIDADGSAIEATAGYDDLVPGADIAPGDTPLLAAVRSGDAKSTRWLLRRGADMDARTWDGLAAIHLAVDQPEVLQELLDRGDDPNRLASNGVTPLHRAALARHPGPAFEVLMRGGAHVSAEANIDGLKGTTPIHALLRHPRAEAEWEDGAALAVALAVSAEIDLAATDSEGLSIHDLLVEAPERLRLASQDPSLEIRAEVSQNWNADDWSGVTFSRIQTEEKLVALTFDDGPRASMTGRVLETLETYGAKATFFVVGQAARAHPSLLQRIVAEGHVIANHTVNHPTAKMSASTAAWEIEEANRIVRSAVGEVAPIFRPPGGVRTNGLTDYALANGYSVAMWDIDTLDWRRRHDADAIYRSVFRSLKPGSVILMHDGGSHKPGLLQALPRILRELERRGYRCVTLPELMERSSAG